MLTAMLQTQAFDSSCLQTWGRRHSQHGERGNSIHCVAPTISQRFAHGKVRTLTRELEAGSAPGRSIFVVRL